ncbi:MAG: hypothetical protein LBC99_04785 [Spirochaetota bacterium]|nr:hypothetical protein [Spirochaetota bacterium]
MQKIFTMITIMIMLGLLIVACSKYTDPAEDFLAAVIQFDETELTKKNVTIAGFVEAIKSLKSGEMETIIQGWRHDGASWVLSCESAGESYEYRFTDVMTDKNNKSIVVFQSVQRSGKHQDPATLLYLIVK